MIFGRVVKFKGFRIREVLVSETGQHYPINAKLCFQCTKNMVEYKACILGLTLALNISVRELLVIGDSDLLIH